MVNNRKIYGKIKQMHNKAIALVALIMIIVSMAIVVVGISAYIVQVLRYNVSGINNEKAFYMAQLGAMRAIGDFKVEGLWNSTRNATAGNDLYYQLGKSANFLFVDATNPSFNNTILERIPVKNINGNLTTSINITQLRVNWTFTGNIAQVRFANQTVFSGNVSNATLLILSPAITINANSTFNNLTDQQFNFTASIPSNATIITTFFFNDSSNWTTYLVNNGTTGNREFSIDSTGQVGLGANVQARKTLHVTYDTNSSGTFIGNITSWGESSSHIIP